MASANGCCLEVVIAIGGIIFIAPSIKADIAAILIVAPAVISQLVARKRMPVVAGEAG